MFEKLKVVFSKQTFLHTKDLILLASISKLRMVSKGEELVKVGDYNYMIMIVIKGLLRYYVIDSNGVEKTLLFVAENDKSASIDSIFHDQPATENIMALENSILVVFDYRTCEKLTADNIRLLRLQNQDLKKVLSDAAERIKYYTLFTPEERYISFCKTYAKLEQRIKQKYLASYLGLTPTSLSRIRARLNSK